MIMLPMPRAYRMNWLIATAGALVMDELPITARKIGSVQLSEAVPYANPDEK